MSTNQKKPTRFGTYTEVDVDIPTKELEDAGWVWAGEPDLNAPTAEDYLEAVARWHNVTHPGAFSFCDHSPCAELREVSRTV